MKVSECWPCVWSDHLWLVSIQVYVGLVFLPLFLFTETGVRLDLSKEGALVVVAHKTLADVTRVLLYWLLSYFLFILLNYKSDARLTHYSPETY